MSTPSASPSTRRAWIEIDSADNDVHPVGVALHTEGVDRNALEGGRSFWLGVALHTEGVDRNVMRFSGCDRRS